MYIYILYTYAACTVHAHVHIQINLHNTCACEVSGAATKEQHFLKCEKSHSLVGAHTQRRCVISFPWHVTTAEPNSNLRWPRNWPDDDIRLYAWTIISTTLSIFTAVLSFSGVRVSWQKVCGWCFWWARPPATLLLSMLQIGGAFLPVLWSFGQIGSFIVSICVNYCSFIFSRWN